MTRGRVAASDSVGVWTAGAVARRLQISTSTLRTWNHRYGVGPPQRRPGEHRRYSEADVAGARRDAAVRRGRDPLECRRRHRASRIRCRLAIGATGTRSAEEGRSKSYPVGARRRARGDAPGCRRVGSRLRYEPAGSRSANNVVGRGFRRSAGGSPTRPPMNSVLKAQVGRTRSPGRAPIPPSVEPRGAVGTRGRVRHTIRPHRLSRSPINWN
jgi:hypothetical protein